MLAAEAADELAHLDDQVLRGAADAVDDPGISVIAAALRAAGLGATAMHDPTEGSLAARFHELASASGGALELDGDGRGLVRARRGRVSRPGLRPLGDVGTRLRAGDPSRRTGRCRGSDAVR